MSIKFVKQFRKWFEARKDKRTARKARRDYMVDWYLNKLDLTCDRKPLPFIDINSTNLNHIIWKKYIKKLTKYYACGYLYDLMLCK